MEIKTFEIRDIGTFVPVIGIGIAATPDPDPPSYLIRRAGYGVGDFLVLLTRLDGGRAHYDPYDWADRTFSTAHHYITQNWDSLEDGAVIDVEYILEETHAPKRSERETF